MDKLKEWYKPGTKRADMAQLDKYMRAVKEFRMQLLILMHITGGQPARAPEILSVRHETQPKEITGICSSKTDWWCSSHNTTKGTQ